MAQAKAQAKAEARAKANADAKAEEKAQAKAEARAKALATKKAKRSQEEPERKAEAVFIPKEKRVPNNPAYLHMKKKDVIQAEKDRIEKDLKTKKYRESLEDEESS